jgi:hypothetical protein
MAPQLSAPLELRQAGCSNYVTSTRRIYRRGQVGSCTGFRLQKARYDDAVFHGGFPARGKSFA